MFTLLWKLSFVARASLRSFVEATLDAMGLHSVRLISAFCDTLSERHRWIHWINVGHRIPEIKEKVKRLPFFAGSKLS